MFTKAFTRATERLFGIPPEAERKQMCLDKARHAQQKVANILHGREEIQAIGISPCKEDPHKYYSVKVNLSSPLPTDVQGRLPDDIEGVRVETQVVGRASVF